MKCFHLFIIFLFSNFGNIIWAQSNNKVLKVKYISSPISSHNMTEYMTRSTPTKASIHEFMRGITDHYSLYVNLEDRSSLYLLDSCTQIRPIGWENPRTTAALTDSVYFTLKTSGNQTYKHEWIMNETFFSRGKVGDLRWDLIDESRTINGLKCHKAVSVNYPLLTVWYTQEIPVSNGPSIFQGLPGLVLWAEDLFRTVEVVDISYSDDMKTFHQRFAEKKEYFDAQRKKKKTDDEPLLIVNKGDMAVYRYERDHNKPYRR